jgi:hypothetical protein
MKRSHIDEFFGGWFIGGFRPTLLHTDTFEVGLKRYKAGDTEPEHYQITATEFTLVIEGRCRIGDVEMGPGDILEIEPNEPAAFEALTPVTLVAIKTPSLPSDKRLGRPQ